MIHLLTLIGRGKEGGKHITGPQATPLEMAIPLIDIGRVPPMVAKIT